jgi:hypothetical protein
MNCGRRFRYNGYRVGVRCDDSTTLAWLEAFLAPSFEVDDGTEFDVDVSMQVNQVEYDALYRGGPALCGTQVVCFTQDGRYRLHPLWQGPRAEKIIFDEEFQLFYRFSSGQAAVRILAANQTFRSRVPLMRVVRELATNDSLRQGHLHVHGSAFTVAGKCVVISGPKGAGKTTLLLSALHGGADGFLTNDRLFVNFGGDRPFARGMPTIVNIWEKSIQMFPGLAKCIEGSMYPDHLTMDGSDRWRFSSPDASGRLRYVWTPAQLCGSLRARPLAQAHLTSIVFPTIVPERDPTLRLEPLPPEAAARKLFAGLLRASAEPALGRFATGIDGTIPDQDKLATMCRTLVSQVKCFECQMGPTGVCDRRSVELFLSRVIA